MNRWAVKCVLALLALWSGSLFAMCSGGGNMGGGGGGGCGSFGGVGGGGTGYPTVSWSSSLESAQAAAQSKNEPFAILFCKSDTASVTGEGTAKIMDARKDPKLKNAKLTVFDRDFVVKELHKNSINTFVKVDDSQKNADVWRKFGAGLNDLVICAPDGSKLAASAADLGSQPSALNLIHNASALLTAHEQTAKTTAATTTSASSYSK